MKISAHDWKIEVKEDYVIVEHRYSEGTKQHHKITKALEVVDSYVEMDGSKGDSKAYKPRIDYDKVNDFLTPKHVDRYGKELKAGDRIYLEDGQKVGDLDSVELGYTSSLVEIDDYFTILEILNSQTICDWNVEDSVSKILTSELNKFTKI